MARQILTALMERAILVLIIALAAVFGIGQLPVDPLTRRFILLAAYFALLSFAVYSFRAKKPGELAPNGYRPVFNRIVIVVVALLGLIPVYWSFTPYSIPELPIKIINTTPTDVQIFSDARFSVRVPVSPVINQDFATGYIQLRAAGKNSINQTLTIPAGGELMVWVRVISPSSYRSYFEQGNAILQIVISRVDHGVIVKQNIPFNMYAFNKYTYQLVIK